MISRESDTFHRQGIGTEKMERGKIARRRRRGVKKRRGPPGTNKNISENPLRAVDPTSPGEVRPHLSDHNAQATQLPARNEPKTRSKKITWRMVFRM